MWRGERSGEHGRIRVHTLHRGLFSTGRRCNRMRKLRRWDGWGRRWCVGVSGMRGLRRRDILRGVSELMFELRSGDVRRVDRGYGLRELRGGHLRLDRRLVGVREL